MLVFMAFNFRLWITIFINILISCKNYSVFLDLLNQHCYICSLFDRPFVTMITIPKTTEENRTFMKINNIRNNTDDNISFYVLLLI